MGFFSDLKDKIFNRHRDPVSTPATSSRPEPSAPKLSVETTAQTATAGSVPATRPVSETASSTSESAASVDVAAILDEAVKESGQTLNWRTSIVDLMKAVDMDSSISSRKELAHELGYAGDTDDSAAMNIWLHKQVLQKLAANGGNVPADLLD